jgi:hypothetical protein
MKSRASYGGRHVPTDVVVLTIEYRLHSLMNAVDDTMGGFLQRRRSAVCNLRVWVSL